MWWTEPVGQAYSVPVLLASAFPRASGRSRRERSATMNRRAFLEKGAAGMAGLGLLGAPPAASAAPDPVLYNGIRLPAPWPPRPRPLTREPVAAPHLQF